MPVRDRVRVAGPEADAFLQGQLSQDMAAIAVGASALSFVLQPQGKVDALVRVTRVAADEFVLDTDAGFGDAVFARLNRFKLRTKADIDLIEPIEAADDEDEDERARIEMGYPKMGAEIDDRTIPAELGQSIIDRAVSFTKGCYTGQELVARIESRGGHVPRPIRRLVIASREIEPGAEVTLDGKVVGRVTSAAWSDERSATVALGPIGRAVAVDAAVSV